MAHLSANLAVVVLPAVQAGQAVAAIAAAVG